MADLPEGMLPADEPLPEGMLPDHPQAPPLTGPDLTEPTQAALDAIPGGTGKMTPQSVFQRNLQDALDGARSSSAGEARKALQVARDVGAPPALIEGRVNEYEKAADEDAYYKKLAMLPRLAAWAAQDKLRAPAIKDELDKWGTLEWMFGRYEADPHALERSQRIAATGVYEPDKGSYQPPGWSISMGKALLSASTNIQNAARMIWGKGITEDEAKRQFDIVSQPVPGDDKAILSKANSIIQMSPLIAAGAVNPWLATGMLYADSAGSTYASMRASGYDHEISSTVANTTGVLNGIIAHYLGSAFQESPIPRQALPRSLTSLAQSYLISMARKPGAWQALLGFGKDFASNMVMNMTMSTADLTVREVYDAAKEGREFNYSKVSSDAASASDAWVEMAVLSLGPSYKAHQAKLAEFRENAPIRVQAVMTAWDRHNQRIYDNYKENGQALNSMHDAAQISAAADSLRESPFAKENPQDARNLIRSLIAPRGSQTVYVSPDALRRLPADKLAMLHADLSMGRNGANVPVNAADLLLHPDSESLVRHTAAGPDLQTLSEATGHDFTRPPVVGEDVPDSRLDEWLASQIRGDRRDNHIPTSEEIQEAVRRAHEAIGGLLTRQEYEAWWNLITRHMDEAQRLHHSGASESEQRSEVQRMLSERASVREPENWRELISAEDDSETVSGETLDGDTYYQTIRRSRPAVASYQEYLAGRAEPRALPDGETRRTASGQRRPPPEVAPETPAPGQGSPAGARAGQGGPSVPTDRASLRRWAADAVSKVPVSELDGIGKQHEELRDQHTEAASRAQKSATEAALAGEDVTQATREARDAKHLSDVSWAMNKAAVAAGNEVKAIRDSLDVLTNGPKRARGTPSPREMSWAAGQVFGEAYDAITEKFGMADRERGYAAPDLSDLYDHLARNEMLGANDFDLPALNELLREGPSSINELSLDQLREVHKAMSGLAQAADAENTVRFNGVRVARGMIRGLIEEHLAKVPQQPPGQRKFADNEGRLSFGQKIKKFGTEALAMMEQPHTLLFKLGAVGDDLWFNHFVPGVARENRLWSEALATTKKIEESLHPDIRASGNDPVDASVLGGDQRWTDALHMRSDVWHLAMHLGVNGADEKIAAGLGIKDEKLPNNQPGRSKVQILHDWVQANLGRTNEHGHEVMSKLIEPHWKHFGELWGEYEQHFKERGIAPPEKLEAKKFYYDGKEYSGGYGGRLKWMDAENKPIIYPGSLEALMESGAAQPPSTNNAHINERDPGFSGVPQIGWQHVLDSMRAEIHDIALRPFIEDAHKVFSDGETRNLIGDKLSKQELNQIYNPHGNGSWLHVVARGHVADIASADWYTRMAAKLQGRLAYSAFSLNTKVMLGQLSHLIAASPGLGLNPLHVSMGTAAAFNPERRAWAHSQSEVLKLRYEDYQERAERLNKELTGVQASTDAIRAPVDHLNWAAWREMDAFLSHSIWEATYAQATANYGITGKEVPATHEEAVRAADKAVTKMMPAQDVYDHSAFVRDRSLAGFSFLVKNFPNTLLNVGILNQWDAKRAGGGIRYTKAAAQYIGMVLAAEFIGKGYMMHLGPSDKEDPEEWGRERGAESLFFPMMLGGLALAAYHASQGQGYKAREDMKRMLAPHLALLGGSLGDLGDIVNDGGEFSDRAMRAGSNLLGLMAKTPVPGIAFNLFNAVQNGDGAADTAAKGLGYRR